MDIAILQTPQHHANGGARSIRITIDPGSRFPEAGPILKLRGAAGGFVVAVDDAAVRGIDDLRTALATETNLCECNPSLSTRDRRNRSRRRQP